MDGEKHTPGPWRIGQAGSAVGVNYSILGKKRYGWVNILKGNGKHGTDTRATPEESMANARLIAAAPDLLEALQAIAAFAVGNGDVCEIIAKRARYAIAKATGETA